MTDQNIEAEIEELRDALLNCRREIGAAFQRGRESREPEIAALRFELRHALEFLDDLEASDNPCMDPDESPGRQLPHGPRGLFRALIAKAEA